MGSERKSQGGIVLLEESRLHMSVSPARYQYQSLQYILLKICNSHLESALMSAIGFLNYQLSTVTRYTGATSFDIRKQGRKGNGTVDTSVDG